MCINTTEFPNTCAALQAVEHEMKHVHQRIIDAKAEQEAYEVSCKVKAKQECWRGKEFKDEFDRCVREGVARSAGAINRAEQLLGCAALCAAPGDSRETP